MKFINNTGKDRVIDSIRPWLQSQSKLDVASPHYSLFAFAELAAQMSRLSEVRLIAPPLQAGIGSLKLLGGEADIAWRNKLQNHWFARQFADWLNAKAEVRQAKGSIPQGTLVLRDSADKVRQAVLGAFAFTTDGLGMSPGNPLSLIQQSDTGVEAINLSQWFNQQWAALQDQPNAKAVLIANAQALYAERDATSIYSLILHHLFATKNDALDEDTIVKAATGIRNTAVWKKLYKFQRDGVVAAIDKLNRFGGCILADSVGLGKTFEALAIIKYHELRNDRVLVLV